MPSHCCIFYSHLFKKKKKNQLWLQQCCSPPPTHLLSVGSPTSAIRANICFADIWAGALVANFFLFFSGAPSCLHKHPSRQWLTSTVNTAQVWSTQTELSASLTVWLKDIGPDLLIISYYLMCCWKVHVIRLGTAMRRTTGKQTMTPSNFVHVRINLLIRFKIRWGGLSLHAQNCSESSAERSGSVSGVFLTTVHPFILRFWAASPAIVRFARYCQGIQILVLVPLVAQWCQTWQPQCDDKNWAIFC